MNHRLALILVLGAACAFARPVKAEVVGDLTGPAAGQLQDASDGDGDRTYDGRDHHHRGDGGDGVHGRWGHDGDRDGGRRDYPRPHGPSTRPGKVPPPDGDRWGKARSWALGDTDKGTYVGWASMMGGFGALVGFAFGPLGALAGAGIGAALGFLCARFLKF